MSGQYSSTIKTQYYDPRTHVNNKMSEFRLDADTMYLPNLRISSLGYFASAASAAPKPVGYYACIKNIRLLDGAVELSSLRFANRYLSFTQKLGTNQEKLCVDSKNSGAANGYVLYPNDKVDTLSSHNLEGADVGTSESEILTGYLDLRKVFPLLASMDCIDTAIFPGLKIQIEYETSPSLLLKKNDETATIQTPVLIADIVHDEQKVAMLRKDKYNSQIMWDEIEHDVFHIPATAQDADAGAAILAKTTGVVNGFDNKYVGRVVMIKQYSDASKAYTAAHAQIGLGNLVSRNQLYEKVQIRKNGSNMFPGEGIISDEYKGMLLYQSWGDVTIQPFTNKCSIGASTPNATEPGNNSGVGTPSSDGTYTQNIAQQDFIGFSVEDTVKQLNLIYERMILKDSETIPRFEQAIDMHIFGEVRKVIEFKNGEYNIVYA